MIAKLCGLRIKELRAECGMSQETFANSIGMSRTYLAGVEAGKRNIGVETLEHIVGGFGLTAHAFFDSELFDEPLPEAIRSQTPSRFDYRAQSIHPQDGGARKPDAD